MRGRLLLKEEDRARVAKQMQIDMDLVRKKPPHMPKQKHQEKRMRPTHSNSITGERQFMRPNVTVRPKITRSRAYIDGANGGYKGPPKTAVQVTYRNSTIKKAVNQ